MSGDVRASAAVHSGDPTLSGGARKVLAKGSNFTGLLRSLEVLEGPDACERAVAALPADLASAIRYGQVVSVGWYPVEWYAELHSAIGHTLRGGPDFARKLGQHATFTDFTSIHRLVVAMLTVETVFGQAHRLMNLYWKGGVIERLEVQRGRGRLLFAGWDGFTRLIWEDIVGGVEAILTVCQAHNVRCRTIGSLEQSSTLELEVRWS